VERLFFEGVLAEGDAAPLLINSHARYATWAQPADAATTPVAMRSAGSLVCRFGATED
jgi:hypothetical protein